MLFVEMVCKSYLSSLIWGARYAFIYVLADMIPKTKYKNIAFIFGLIAVVQSIIIFLLPISIFDDGNVVYTYGASVTCVYAFVVIYILLTFIIACFLYKKINPRRGLAIILWMTIWTVSAVIQFFNNQLLIVGFASALGVLILFVIIENPEATLDKGLGCFNSYAMEAYINQLIEQKQHFGILEISFEKTNVFEEAHLDADKIMHNMLHILKPYKNICVFKNINLSFVLVSEKTEQLQEAGDKLVNFFSGFDVLNREVMFLLTTKGD